MDRLALAGVGVVMKLAKDPTVVDAFELHDSKHRRRIQQLNAAKASDFDLMKLIFGNDPSIGSPYTAAGTAIDSRRSVVFQIQAGDIVMSDCRNLNTTRG